MAENQEEVVESLWNAYPEMGYASYDESKDGMWRTFSETEGEDPIAILWTDNDQGTGVVWTKQTEKALRIFKMLIVMKMRGEPAPSAFNIMSRIVEGHYGEIEDGPLSKVSDKFWEMSETNG